MKKLEGKTAIITGASRGVGEYMALEFAKEGCNVVVAARTETEGQSKLEGTIAETAAKLQAMGVRALPVRCDVTDEDSVNAMVERAAAEFGRIDILVNNAGIMAPQKLIDMPLKRWDLLWRVNVRGAIACSKAVLPHMIAQSDGVIFNISSIAADQDQPGNISYMLTKHALRELAKGLAAEEKAHNIRVFALSPYGWVPTPGTLFYRLDETMPEWGRNSSGRRQWDSPRSTFAARKGRRSAGSTSTAGISFGIASTTALTCTRATKHFSRSTSEHRRAPARRARRTPRASTRSQARRDEEAWRDDGRGVPERCPETPAEDCEREAKPPIVRHLVAAKRHSVFDEVAELYDRVRPSYPVALIDEMLAMSGISRGGRILEIGCGRER